MGAARRGRPPGVKNRPKSDPNNPYDVSDVETLDVTEQGYPEGVPTNDDGSVASESEMTMEQAQRIGALSAESAQQNRDLARKAALKQRGIRSVKWGVNDVKTLFDEVRKVYPGSSIHVTRTNPQPSVDFRPFMMSICRNSGDLYDYILKNFHRASAETEYMVIWRSDSMERGRGYIRLPDNTHEAAMMQQQQQQMQQQSPMPPFGMSGPPQQPFYPMPSPAQPMYHPSAYTSAYNSRHPPGIQGFENALPPETPAPWKRDFQKTWEAPTQQHAPEPPQRQQEPPQQAPAPYQAPQQQQLPYPQQQPYMPQQPMQDPAVYGHLASSYQEVQRMQQLIMQNQLQIQHALGALEEIKRQSGMMGAMPPMQYAHPNPQPLPPQPQQAPQVAMVVAPPAPSPNDLMAQLQNATNVITTMSQAMANIRGAVSKMPQPMPAPVAAVPIVDVPEPPEELPFQMVPLGVGENPPMVAMNREDSSFNWGATVMANLPKLMEGISSIQQQVQNAQNAQQHHPQYPQQQHYPQPQQQVYVPPQPLSFAGLGSPPISAPAVYTPPTEDQPTNGGGFLPTSATLLGAVSTN